MDLGLLQARLGCDVSQLNAAESSLRQFGNTAGSTFSQASGHASNFGSQMAALVGVSLSVGAALAVVKKNIDAISDTSLKSIAGAAMMVSRETIEGVEAQQAAYGEYRAYILNMYKELNAETQNHFASGKEMIGSFNALVQMGIYASQDEAKSIGVITDAVKLLHGGYVDQVTVQHEIRGLLEGHAGIHYKLAQQLSTMIGPEWKKIVRDQAEAGTLLTFLEEKYKGLSVASGDIQKTLTAQQTTLDTLLSQIGKAGLSGMYEDIVGWVSQINQYLREHKDELASKIASTWEGMRGSVYGVASGVGAITAALGDFAGQLDKISNNPAFMTLFGVAAGSRFGPLGAVVGGALGLGKGLVNMDKESMKNFQPGGPYGEAAESFYGALPAPGATPPPWKPALGAPKGGGGKSTEGAENAMKSFIETMNQEVARAAGDTEAILGAWYGKQLVSIQKWKDAGLDTTGALAAADAAYYSKLTKLNDTFQDWYISGLGNSYEALLAAEHKKLLEVAGNAEKEAKVQEVFTRKHYDLEQQMETDRLGLFKGYLDSMSSLSPILTDQLGYKRQALDLELKLAEITLNRQLNEGKITRDTYDQITALRAVEAQAKKFNLEMENNKGLQGWAYQRVKSDSQKNTWADAMGGLEDFVNNAWTQGVQGALSKTKVDYMEVAKTMAQSFILNLGKQGITWGFGQIAKGILGDNLSSKLGTEANPMVVTIKGMGLSGLGKGFRSFEHTAQRAGKIGYSTGGGGGHDDDLWNFTDMYKKERTFDRAFDADLKGWIAGTKNLEKASNGYSDSMGEIIKQNQDAFKTQYLTDYEGNFQGMATNITGIWGTAQGLMTAAGVSGEAQRYGAMVSYGMQGVELLYNIVAKGTLAKAWSAGASAYASVWEFLGFPLAVPLAPIMAAVAFAGTLAAGSGMWGGGGGGGGYEGTGPGNNMSGSGTPSPYHSGGHLQPYYAHAGFPPLKPGEVPFIGLDTERVLSPRQTYDYEAGLREGGGGGRGETHVHYHDNRVINAIDARGVEAVLEKQGRALVRIINKNGGVGTRGQKLGDGRG